VEFTGIHRRCCPQIDAGEPDVIQTDGAGEKRVVITHPHHGHSASIEFDDLCTADAGNAELFDKALLELMPAVERGFNGCKLHTLDTGFDRVLRLPRLHAASHARQHARVPLFRTSFVPVSI